MIEYTLSCPICETATQINIKDNRVVYYIEAFESSKSLRSIFSHNPDEIVGKDLMIDKNLVGIIENKCPEGHNLNIHTSHYKYVEEQNRLHGPAKEPVVRCPSCKYKLDDHENHIINLDSSLKMQFVLRNVSLRSKDNYNHVEAITRSEATKYNQISTQRFCENCGELIHFNYSSRLVNKSKNYEGMIQSESG